MIRSSFVGLLQQRGSNGWLDRGQAPSPPWFRGSPGRRSRPWILSSTGSWWTRSSFDSRSHENWTHLNFRFSLKSIFDTTCVFLCEKNCFSKLSESASVTFYFAALFFSSEQCQLGGDSNWVSRVTSSHSADPRSDHYAPRLCVRATKDLSPFQPRANPLKCFVRKYKCIVGFINNTGLLSRAIFLTF